MTRPRAVALGALCVVAAAAAAWSLAYPQNSLGATVIRALSDGAAVVTLGLVVVPMFDEPRHRDELANRAAGPLILASAMWAVAELVRLFVGAAEAAGTSVLRIGLGITVQFATDTAAGRSNLVCLAAAAVVCVIAAAAPRTSTSVVVVAGAAAIGMAGRSLVGHLSASPLGGVAVAVHTLAAAVWCGALAALVLTTSHRGQWARVLPRFSRASLVCVVVLLVCGVAGAVVTLSSAADLFATGYGRVLTAKVIVTAVLVGLAWRNRIGWLPAAQTHRASAGTSHSRSRVELAIMAVALTFAAALAVTG